MGIGDRRLPLPAATDSLIDSAGDESPVEQDLATDLSRRSDATHHTVPDDGTPITIPTTLKRSAGHRKNTAQQSQASLLIEYFESNSDPERRPSIRVRVAPSRSKQASRTRSQEALPTKTPSQSHRVPLRSLSDESSELFPMATQRLSRPFEPEFHQASEISALSDSPPLRFNNVPESDISSMPADSMLGVPGPAADFSRAEMSEKENLKPPVLPADRNVSAERLTQKVKEKLASRPRTVVTKPTSSERSRSSVSREVEGGHARRRAVKNIEEDSMTGTGSSLVSGSMLSAEHKSHDQRSVKSGQSQVSINNPKLLQTVEDAIRRLILPELKEIKKDQRHGSRRRTKEYPSDLSESSLSREEISRRRSSGSKSRRKSSGKDHSSRRISSGSKRHERERHQKSLEYESPSENSYRHSESISSLSVEDDSKAQKARKSHRTRDATAGALAGAALTAAALKHHDSGSSLDHREKRKKRSKSRSTRTESIAEDEDVDVFHKHNVPAMPMRSEIDSEVTRSSLLSSNTNGTLTPTRREVRQVVHGSPNELRSPTSATPSRTPVEKEKSSPEKSPLPPRTGLGMHHGNFSEQDLAATREGHDQDDEGDDDEAGFSPSYGLIGHGLLDPERAKAYERNLHHQHPIRRGLSPIQSVASYATTEPNRTSLVHPRSQETLSSHRGAQQDDISEASFSSANSIDAAKGYRPHGLSLENRSEIMRPHKDGTHRLEYGGLDSAEGQYRGSFASSDGKESLQARSTFTDDSLDEPYVDKVTAGQQVAGLGANPRFVDLNDDVESAVASLCEPSVLDSKGAQSSHGSRAGSPQRYSMGSSPAVARSARSGSPLKHQTAVSDIVEPGMSRGIAPPVIFATSGKQSKEKVAEPSSPHDAAIGDSQDANSPESEITTNPSVIQGPIAGYATGDTSHWPYGPTPPPVDSGIPGSRDLSMTAPELMPEPLTMSHGPGQKPDTYIGRAAELTPPGVKDEGYETGANAPSPAIMPSHHQPIPKGLPFSQDMAYDDDLDDDPFTTSKRDQYVSGLSHGMSPMYDTATGRAADRIYDKDVRALMDHLTVRDAQRNARDTEILITLVRTAAEMRNSFEDMKKLVAEQGDNYIDESNKQHERTLKVIGGPRPQPVPRNARTPASEEEDLPTKRRNVFRRALMGLGSKNTQELQNIEGMLMQLLDDVEGLRALHTGPQASHGVRSNSAQSAENGRVLTDAGYEPEGQAGTSSTGDRSGIFSNNSSRQADYRGYNIRQGSANRVSTVMERDEEYYDNDGYLEEQQQTPRASGAPAYNRGASEPVQTPPRMANANQGTLSNEHTPHYSTESSSGRKHKSFASSLLPKMVSRWSKTTASSGDFRASAQTKQRPYSQVSQSGSNIAGYDYDPHGDDAIRSNMSLEDERYRNENRPPSPLIPSQVSDNHPKYQSYRDSINLQHPRPRHGPTERHHNQMESVARTYADDPISPNSVTSSQWEAQAALSGMPGMDMHNQYEQDGQISPASDRGERVSQTSISKQGPPRPPKVPENDPLMPPRPPKVVMSPPASRQPTYVDHVTAARAGSPALDKSPVAALKNSPGGQVRKPSGPRPISSSGQYHKGYGGDLNAVKRTRFRGSPNQIDSDEDLASQGQYA
ncbi:uncharacterized protein HMPREF1541_09196 [Cyphellophora europaea CBS 101466]|uniref:Transaldolase n=1 Tax=Cyphellophora europaea (strain CBS 101466) TaxID=1220924 RepID=W2S9S0_CYPE1|nr:uncharacterized protein HMPREF1541_09196 [Cyphellophora europaea CBS 101466]ETN45365.1 hypothetical protein HMPREF1541_09196 [Cyphellophora europaea CBS 101466]